MSPAAARRTAGLLLLLALGLALGWQHFGLGRWLSLEQLKAGRDSLQALVQARPLASAAGFFALYVAAAVLCLPGITVLSLAGGALFGLGPGVLMVSFASSLGALLVFLAVRGLLHDAVHRRFQARLAAIDEGLRRDGDVYLLTLRLVPLLPYFVVNLLMGLTPLGAGRYYLCTQLGMLPATLIYVNAGTQLATLIYVNAGTQLATLNTLQDVLSPALFLSLLALGLLPLLARAAARRLRRG